MQKRFKQLLALVVIVFLAYNSVYFKKLSLVKEAHTSSTFNSEGYAKDYFYKKLPLALDKAIDINDLFAKLQTEPQKTFDTYSHALGIGNIRYFLIKGEGEVLKVEDDATQVLVRKDSANRVVRIATEYVFGNAVRDASGLININEFSNTMDFNNVSAEINKLIRSQVLPAFTADVKKEDQVQFTGAIELNAVHLKLNDVEVVPVRLKIVR